MDASRARAWAFALLVCFFTNPTSQGLTSSQRSYDEELGKCVETIRGILEPARSEAPQFISLEEASKWMGAHLPSSLRKPFGAAGSDVNAKIIEWTRSGAIHSMFWNTQLMYELLYSQYLRFDGLPGCEFYDGSGVPAEVVQDQLYILFLMDSPLESALRKLGLEDSSEMKRALMYSILLENTGSEWSEKNLVSVVKYSAPLD